MENELPKGWVDTTIDSISSKIQYGYTAKSKSDNKGIRYLRITDIQNKKVDWENVPICEIDEANLTKFSLNKGDIVFARTGATVGKSFLIKDIPYLSVFASYLIRLSPVENIDVRLIKYFFYSNSYWQQISKNATGIGQPNVNATKLSALKIPLPPLAEQKRIVAKLDGLFAHQEQLQKALARIPILLKQFRQSVLTEAVMGKLTEAVDVSNWKNIELAQITDLVTKGASPKWQGINYVEEYNNKSILFITSENVNRFKILESKFKYLEIGFNDIQKRSILQEGDVLTNIVGGSIGRTTVWNYKYRANINQAVCLIRPKQDFLLSKYLAIHLNSDLGLKYLFENVVDVARANVSLGTIKN